MVIVETSFPRGGTIKAQKKQNDIDFGARQEKRRKDKPKKKGKSDVQTKLPKEIKAVSAELLNHKTIQEGMVVMGVVKSAEATSLKVSLPGRIVGSVLASSISDSYNKLMYKYVDGQALGSEKFKTLPELFHVGQVICTKVIEISNSDESRLQIKLSLKPEDMHSEFNHQHLRKGQMLFGAIEEVQDHGYVIESGVRNLRCFLPFESSEEGLNVGSIVCIRIEKLTQASAASTAVCRLVERGNRKLRDLTEPNLDYILPTTVVNFTVTKILSNGIQGTIMNGTFTGYINEHQLSETFHVPTDYSVDSNLSARILYVMPLTKLIYLSLRTSMDLTMQQKLKRGDVVNEAVVKYIGTGGVVVDLEGRGKGLISFNSIKANYIGNYDQDEMLAKYKKKSKHKVRIIEFDLIDDLYACSDNPAVVNEKFYTLGDLKPGDYVTGVVGQKDSFGGYSIRVGNVRGLIEKMFLASTSGHLKEGAKIQCRVTWTNPQRNVVYLTNRNEYMSETAKVPSQMSSIKPNRVFLGTAVKETEKCYVIRFFANIKGILYKSKLSILRGSEFVSLYEGATMNFRIESQDGEKITLGLAEEMHKMGEICDATVTNIIQQGIEIVIPGESDEKVKGLVPVRLLSDFQDLVSGHLRTYNLGDQITVACILKNLYSIRDVVEFNEKPAKPWKYVQPGDIMKGLVKNVEGDVIEVLLPIINYNRLVKIHLNMFLERAVSEANIVLVPDQAVLVKVLSKENLAKTLTLSAKLTEVWDCQLKTTGELFARFLGEVNKIKKALKAQNKAIASYKIGEKMNGKVSSYSKIDGEWIVELPNNLRGVIRIPEGSIDKTLEVGKEVTCTILWIDYSMDVLYLTHKASDGDRIVPGLKLVENLKHVNGLNAKVLLKTSEFLVCLLKKGQNTLFFVPTKLHFNDFENTSVATIAAGDFVRLSTIHEKYPIAVTEKAWKFWRRMNTPKRKIDNRDGNQSKDTPRKKLKLTPVEDGNASELTSSNSVKNGTRKVGRGQEKNDKRKRSNEHSWRKNDTDDIESEAPSDEKESDEENEEEKLSSKRPRPNKNTEDEIVSEESDADDGQGNEDASTATEEEVEEESSVVEEEDEEDDTAEENESDFKDDEVEDSSEKIDDDSATDDEVDVASQAEDDENDATSAEGEAGNISDEANDNEDDVGNNQDDSHLYSKNNSNSKSSTHEKLKENYMRGIDSKDRTKQERFNANPLLPGANGFWSTNLETLHAPAKKQTESSDEDSDNKEANVKKKKKLTAAAKFKLAQEEEARLRQIEENYANPNRQPETVDEFDRMVVANPNSSIKWINYMVFHLQAAEIDKARSVARRALKSISFREEQEKINVWIALLNLELRYGTKESFTETLKESTLCNDAYKIYTRCLQILSDAKKVQELNELIPTLTRKFRDKSDIWKHAATAYFEVGLPDKAKQLLHRALAALPEREHINTIATFANLHHKNGDKETAHTLMDQIVSSYPKRLDVWSQYVDILIKDNDIEAARKVLDRAVSQKIPIKKMRTLFKKYLEFAEKHGSEEMVQNVKQMAADYVKVELEL